MSTDEDLLILRLEEISKGYWHSATSTQCQLAKRLMGNQRMAGWKEDAQALIDKISSQPRKPLKG